MKQYQVGEKIKPHESELPENITRLLYDKHYCKYFEADSKISEKQRKVIEDRVRKIRYVVSTNATN